MKWLKRILIVVVVLVVIAAVAIYFGGNYAAKKGVEVGGTAALGVDTKLDSVSIGWFSSTVGMRGLSVGNPEGYKTDRLMALGEGKVSCSIGSLMSDEVQVSEILIDQPELTVELKMGLPPKSNLGDLLSSLTGGEAAEPAGAETAADKKFKVDLIRINKTKVRFHMVGGKTADFVLPDIEMKDLKNADGTPLMLADIFRQVLASMAVSVAKNGKGVPGNILGQFGDTTAMAKEFLGDGMKNIKGLGDAGKLLEGATKGLGEGGKGIGDAGKKVGDKLKGLFSKDKKDDK